MRAFTIILLLITISSCKGQTQKEAKEDAFNVSHGVALDRIDSALVKDIRFAHFDNSIGVIFPKEYANKRFGKTMGREKHVFFTPDTILIKQIDKEIINQYCIALTRFDSAVWDRTIENLKEDKDNKSLRRAKKQMADQKESLKKNCPQWQHELSYYDRQYIGYMNDIGEKIIYIQLLDFRQDPYKLKPAFGISWIDGWHGWFETNRTIVHFHIDRNLVTINEDL